MFHTLGFLWFRHDSPQYLLYLLEKLVDGLADERMKPPRPTATTTLPKKMHRQTRSGINRTFSRPIIFRVAQWRTRSDIFKKKRLLKGKKISICESLTSLRYERYQAPMVKYGKGNVWTSEGRILTKTDGNIPHLSFDDL